MRLKRLAMLPLFVAVLHSGCASMGAKSKQIERVTLDGNCSEENAAKAHNLLFEAEKLLDHGKVLRAEKKLLLAIDLNPELGTAHNNLGLVFFGRRQFYEAAHAFQRASINMPDSGLPHYNLGMVFEESGRLEEAVEQYEQAYALEPLVPAFIGNLARARLKRGEPCDCVAHLLRELVLLDTRPDWIEWAEDELALAGAYVSGQDASEESTTHNEEPDQTQAAENSSLELSAPNNLPPPAAP